MPEGARYFEHNLQRWVQAQKVVLDSVTRIESELEHADRLDLIIAARVAFQHIIRTAQAFDKWLQDPFIIGHMPKEMLVEVQRKVWKILKELLELDIKHTSEFAEHVDRLAKEGKLNPILYSKGPEREGPRLIL